MKHSWWFYKAALVSMARKECLPYGRTLRLSAPTGFHRATRIPFSRPPIEVMLHRGWHKLEDYNIKIYPNPTHGFLKVSISGLKSTDKCSMCLYTTQGTQIITNNVNKDGFEINISNQPIGIYLLRITINNNSTIWKIVKK